MQRIRVIGGGLAGCEAAYQLLKRGYKVDMYEMRKGGIQTPCHHTDMLGELVCSNSLKSKLPDTASGTLKAELALLDCMLLRVAESSSVPAGGALAVNRVEFSTHIEKILTSFDGFRIIGEEVTQINEDLPTIVATGPLTSDTFSKAIAYITGNQLSFYDAAAPIIDGATIDYDKVFYATRYGKGESTDYLNSGMNAEQFAIFYNALINAEVAELHEFDKRDYFDGCMPIEVMAKRGIDTIRYGMLKPKGIVNSATGKRYYAVAQLRKENSEGSSYNLVGFQTNLTFNEQKRVFRLLPGLENAEFYRYGVMHRNTYINAPKILDSSFKLKAFDNIYFAGQICGVEGYMESVMSGLLSAVNLDAAIHGRETILCPATTICGALQRYISTDNANYQPMNSNYGILPELDKSVRDKKLKKAMYGERAIEDMCRYLEKYNSDKQ